MLTNRGYSTVLLSARTIINGPVIGNARIMNSMPIQNAILSEVVADKGGGKKGSKNAPEYKC